MFRVKDRLSEVYPVSVESSTEEETFVFCGSTPPFSTLDPDF